MIKLDRKLVLPYGLVLAAVFYGMLMALGLNTLIAVLNGAFIGALAAITVTYSRVMRSWFWGARPNDGVSMFGLFFMLLWAILGLFIFNSIYVRASDQPFTTLMTTAIGRYGLIICAWGLIASLDYGEAWYYGRDRKLLLGGVVLGSIVAVILIYMQQYQVLS